MKILDISLSSCDLSCSFIELYFAIVRGQACFEEARGLQRVVSYRTLPVRIGVVLVRYPPSVSSLGVSRGTGFQLTPTEMTLPIVCDRNCQETQRTPTLAKRLVEQVFWMNVVEEKLKAGVLLL